MSRHVAPIFLSLRVDAATKRTLEVLAKRAGKSVPAYVRELTIAEVARSSAVCAADDPDRRR